MKCIARCLVPFTLALTMIASPAMAQVTSPTGFMTRVQIDIRGEPMKVYNAFLQVGQWWSSDHTFSGDARNVTLDARAGGCFCERLKNGGSVEHMRVIHASPGQLLRMSGALGPLQSLGVAGSMSVVLKPIWNGTSLELNYSVGGFSEGGFQQLAPAVQSVLSEQMTRLKSFVETGRAAAPGSR